MSNDEEEQPRPMFIPASAIFGQQSSDPEEEARAEMAHQNLFFQWGEWLQSATAEELTMVRKMLGMAMSDKATGHQLLGMVAGVSHLRFNNCIGCSENHFKDLEDGGK